MESCIVGRGSWRAIAGVGISISVLCFACNGSKAANGSARDAALVEAGGSGAGGVPGGATGRGGGPGSGGVMATGGAYASGGAIGSSGGSSSGGVSAGGTTGAAGSRAGTGGDGGTLDASMTGGTGGGPALGGAGGISATGGVSNTGGRSGLGGTSASGGASGSGGIPGSGGMPGSGGTNASGGAPGTGGVLGTGGLSASGGRSGTGGSTATGGVVGTGGSAAADAGTSPATLRWEFATDSEGWSGDFAEYPPGVGTGYDLSFGWSALPAEVGPGGGLRISGNNHSDDLFSYVMRPISGLLPDHTYVLDVEAVIDTNAPASCSGIGGAPGLNVAFKIGASSIQPATSLNSQGYLVLNLDKGNQSQGGADMKVVGNIGNTHDCPDATYQAKTLTLSGFSVTSSSAGIVWVILGTDSGFEGATTLYYDRITVAVRP